MLSDASLPPACRDFRAAFPRLAGHRHRRTCPACAAWAVHREAVAVARETKRPMPSGLAERLRAIPQEVKECPAAEVLVRAARDSARGRSAAPAVAAHFASCACCRRLVAVLVSGFAASPRALPAALAARLRQIGPKIPRRGLVWAFDLRAASVAALLIGLLLLPVAEPTAALVRQAGSAVADPIAGWRAPHVRVIDPGGLLAASFEPVRRRVAQAFGHTGDKLSTYLESWVSLTVRAQSIVERMLRLETTEPVSPDTRPGDDHHDDR